MLQIAMTRENERYEEAFNRSDVAEMFRCAARLEKMRETRRNLERARAELDALLEGAR